MTVIKRNDKGVFMVADLLEKEGSPLAPVVKYLGPFFCPPVPPLLRPVIRTALVPTLNWQRPEAVPGDVLMTDIDANAAYLSAASSNQFAHGRLENTGPHDAERDFIHPGYYLVDVHPWSYGAPGSPLGSAHIPTSRVWITHNTYMCLRDLTFGSTWSPGGHWPDCTAYDSWTCTTSRRFTKWTDVIRDFRADLIDQGDEESLLALKNGYSQAIQMWATPPDPKGTPVDKRKKHNKAYRPDWYHAVRAQSAYNHWRRAYQCAELGYPPVSLGGSGHTTDGLAFTSDDLHALLLRPGSPIRLDETGTQLGTYKRLRTDYPAGADKDSADEQ